MNVDREILQAMFDLKLMLSANTDSLSAGQSKITEDCTLFYDGDNDILINTPLLIVNVHLRGFSNYQYMNPDRNGILKGFEKIQVQLMDYFNND